MSIPKYENEFNTFEGWKSLGRGIKTGSKSFRRDKHGAPVFHIDQTYVYSGKIYVPRERSLPRSEFRKRYGY